MKLCNHNLDRASVVPGGDAMRERHPYLSRYQPEIARFYRIIPIDNLMIN